MISRNIIETKYVLSSGPVWTTPQDNKTVRDFDDFICFIVGEMTLLMEKVFDDGIDGSIGNHKSKDRFGIEEYNFVFIIVWIKASVNPSKVIENY